MHLRVYDDVEGTFITIRPSPDFPDTNVLVVAEGAENVEYFGDIRLDLPLEMMEKIGKAIMCVVASIPNRHEYA